MIIIIIVVIIIIMIMIYVHIFIWMTVVIIPVIIIRQFSSLSLYKSLSVSTYYFEFSSFGFHCVLFRVLFIHVACL